MPNRQSFIHELKSFIDACVFCAEEMRKECTLIKTKVRKQQKINTLASESLSDKCIKVIVNDPGLLLVASTQYQFPDETVWKRMHELAPAKLTPAFKEALEESKEANGVWM
jgi:hypothetical protein